MTEIGHANGLFPIPLDEAIAHGVTNPPQLEISWAMRSDVGHRRKRNEDSAISVGDFFAIADGMGGHAAGDRASAAVVTHLAEGDVHFPLQMQNLYSALLDGSQEVTEISDESGRDAGTTVTGVGLTVNEGEVCWLVFNIGDSRVYAFVDDGLVQVTRDHSLVMEMVARGEITEAQAERHPARNQIIKAIGFDMDPVPDMWLAPATPGMRLLVCSDGLCKELSHDEIQQQLIEHPTASAAADALLQGALEHGGSDNVTLIVIDTIVADETSTAPVDDDDTATRERSE